MAKIFKDRALETTTTTGTGNITLAGAANAAHTTIGLGAGDTFDYVIFAVDSYGNPSGAWETGVGTYVSAGVFSRTVSKSSNADALVDFAAGTKYVACTAIAATIAALLTPPTESIVVALGDETTAITAGNSKVTLRMPYAFTVTDVRASLATAQTSGSILTVDVNDSGTTILSTKLTIDNTEKTSTTAAIPRVISDTALADDAEITFNVDQVGDGTAKGLKVTLIGKRVA